MSRIAACVVSLVFSCLCLGCAGGQGHIQSIPEPPSVEKPASLDDLFARLRGAASDGEAQRIELAIFRVWASSGRPDIDDMMLSGLEMVHVGDLDGAVATFDEVVARDPEFVEVYNQRATVHVLREEYPEAVADYGRVLRLEPRHFGALAGLGHVLLLFDRNEAALKCFVAALSLNPHLDAIREEADDLRQKMAGVPI